MTRSQDASRSARDDALDRLHRITTGLAVGGVAATAGFGALAAATFTGLPQDGGQAAVVDQQPTDSSLSDVTAGRRARSNDDHEGSNDEGERSNDEGDDAGDDDAVDGGQAFRLTNPVPAPSHAPLAGPANPPAAAPPTRAHVSTGGSG